MMACSKTFTFVPYPIAKAPEGVIVDQTAELFKCFLYAVIACMEITNIYHFLGYISKQLEPLFQILEGSIHSDDSLAGYIDIANPDHTNLLIDLFLEPFGINIEIFCKSEGNVWTKYMYTPTTRIQHNVSIELNVKDEHYKSINPLNSFSRDRLVAFWMCYMKKTGRLELLKSYTSNPRFEIPDQSLIELIHCEVFEFNEYAPHPGGVLFPDQVPSGNVVLGQNTSFVDELLQHVQTYKTIHTELFQCPHCYNFTDNFEEHVGVCGLKFGSVQCQSCARIVNSAEVYCVFCDKPMHQGSAESTNNYSYFQNQTTEVGQQYQSFIDHPGEYHHIYDLSSIDIGIMCPVCMELVTDNDFQCALCGHVFDSNQCSNRFSLCDHTEDKHFSSDRIYPIIQYVPEIKICFNCGLANDLVESECIHCELPFRFVGDV